MMSLLLVTGGAQAQITASEIQFSYGFSADSMNSARIAWRSAPLSCFELPAWTGQPALLAETSLTYIQNTKSAGSDLTLAGLSPVLQWHLTGEQRPVYLEAGIGVAALDRRRVSGRDLGSQLQFEDMLRLSWQYREGRANRLSLAFVHYSNGSLKGPNHGLNLYQLSWIRPF